jgi:type IV pilus assembly protein PilA
LAQTPAFKQALTHVGEEGNGLGYVSPRFFARLRDVEKLNPSAPPEMQSMLHMITSRLPVIDRPLVGVRTNFPDGILVRSYINRSLKQELVMSSLYNPVTIGVMAAMAIPAFQKVRMASQEKAVLNNLRQLAAAADQFYLERGVAKASYSDLVGPKGYIKRLVPVAGENYQNLRFVQGQALSVKLSNGKVVEYNP